MSTQGHFIQLAIYLDRVPLPWSCPWLERLSSQLCMSLSCIMSQCTAPLGGSYRSDTGR